MDRGIIDVKGNELCEILQIVTILQVRIMGADTEELQKISEEIHPEHKGVTIPVQVRWLSNPQTIRNRVQRGDIKVLSVFLIVTGKKVAQRLVINGVTAAEIRYKVEPYTSTSLNSECHCCCEWGHVVSKCSHHQLKCSYCAGLHQSGKHRFKGVGCALMQAALCSLTQEKCQSCKGILIAFNWKCMRTTEAIGMVQQSRRLQPNG